MTKMNELTDSEKNKLNSTSYKVNITEGDSEDESEVTLAPFIQTYLAHSGSGNGCGCLPVPFERAAPHSWMRPCFDSDILENQFKISSLKQFTKKFRYALIYMMIISVVWLIFLLYQSFPHTMIFEYVIFAQLFLFAIWILFLSYKDVYLSYGSIFEGAIALHLIFTALVFTLAGGTTMVSHFTVACSVILVIYTVVPLQPYISLILCLFFSIVFEIIFFTTQRHLVLFYYGFVVRILCEVCVHIIGFHILVMTHVRVRGTFMKVGQRLLVRKQLEMEKQLKEKIIHSVMPPKVAGWLLSGENGDSHSFARPSNHDDFGSLFRPFNMNRMHNVSILFADIVGFTKMSSNKTAEEIVDILNDLFERFDDLCLTNGCEKISTLGDCYYCVSGCPEPRSDHAKCCVEMGLDMIDAIQEFDNERGEDVNMRVGVHTGTVLCGIVGTRRFKFDVWSNDVTFANKLESTGLPGRVHISESTALFLRGSYTLENYEDLQGTKTYLIKSRNSLSRRDIQMAESSTSTSDVNYTVKRKSDALSQPSTKKTHYLSLLASARSKFASLPNVMGSNRALANSTEKIGSSKWFSFSKLKKNSTANVASSLKHLNGKYLDDDSFTKETAHKLKTFKGNFPKHEELRLYSAFNNRNLAMRSNRRSSIQQQIYLLNGFNQDESGAQKFGSHHNSTRSALSQPDSDVEGGDCKSVFDNVGVCFYSLRKQSDLQLIKCINDISLNSYVVKVPLDRFTLFFKDKKTEKEYRANAHRIREKKGTSPVTLSSSRFNTYFDIFVSGLVLACTTISLYILYEPAPHFIAVSTTALLLESIALFLSLVHLIESGSSKFKETTKFFSGKIIGVLSKWYPWHVFGGALVSLPIIVILSSFTGYYKSQEDQVTMKNITFDFLATDENKKLTFNVELRDHYYTLLVLVGIIHFCNFTQLNFFMKSLLALITGIIYLLLLDRGNYQYRNISNKSIIFIGQFLQRNIFTNQSQETDRKTFLCFPQFEDIIEKLSLGVFDAQNYYDLGVQFLDLYYYNGEEGGGTYFATDDGIRFLGRLNESKSGLSKDDWLKGILYSIGEEVLIPSTPETFLNILIVVILVILLNREFEISYRFNYYCNTESSKDKMRVQNMKNQADWLLENIIPKHVSVELKNRAKYCKNHSNVGIIFASIVNFNKLYDESYSGGKEYLRVLNELISDFDELLNLEKFKNVDKIKTIGSTFMGASGLNPSLRKENKSEFEHIFQLMNFALEMYKVVDVFNRDLLGFNLILRVGFNIGEVTAGVIGSSKLFYDIWGDAVNVASRMDSCGVDGRIQVPHSCLHVLSGNYNFEPRGSVSIKGKGDILVYLVKQ